MARTLSEDDQDWPAVDQREESPEQVRLPAWGWLAVAFGLAFWLRGPLDGLLDGPALGTWTTVFVSISVQALPFLVLGVMLSGAITALVPPGWLARVLPHSRWWRCRRPGWPGSPCRAVSAERSRSPAG